MTHGLAHGMGFPGVEPIVVDIAHQQRPAALRHRFSVSQEKSLQELRRQRIQIRVSRRVISRQAAHISSTGGVLAGRPVPTRSSNPGTSAWPPGNINQ